MKEEWRQSTWGDEISLEYGKAIRGYQDAIAPFRVFGSNGPIGWTENALADGPGVILGRKGAYRGVHFSREPFFVIDTAYYVKPKADLDMRYLYYSIIDHKLGEIDDGSPIPSTTRAAVYVREVYIPPLPEQRAIAATLGSLDDKIELNRRMNETLEAMARAIFKDWFVDFGPTRAKAEGRAPYLAPDLWDLFPEKLDDEEKPEGWESFTLADLAHHHRATVSPSADPEHTFEHYSIPGYDTGNAPTLDLGGSIKSNKTVVPEGAVLLSKLNPEIERVWLPDPKGELSQVASTEFLAFTPLACATRTVLFCMFKSEAFRAEMAAMVTGTSKSHQRVSPKVLITREVLTTDPQLLAAFDEIVRPFLDRLLANRREARTLAKTRDLLLPKLMSGEIRVSDAEHVAAD